MKALTILIIALAISVVTARAQAPQGQPRLPAAPASDQQADLLKEISDFPPDKVERLICFQNRTLRTVLGVHVEYTGVLPELKRAEHPWQLLNPFAPASYGDGYNTLSFSPATGPAPGFILFAIRF